MKAEIVLKPKGYGVHLPFDLSRVKREIDRRMETEHENHYGTPQGWGKGAGYSRDTEWSTWTTSAGNKLMVRLDNQGALHIWAIGRRHGIPWRFIPENVRDYLNKKFNLADPHDYTYRGRHHVLSSVEIRTWESQRIDLFPWQTVGDHPSQWEDSIAHLDD